MCVTIKLIKNRIDDNGKKLKQISKEKIMFGKKKEILTIEILADIIKNSDDEEMKSVEKFDFDSNSLTIILSNQVGNKFRRSVALVKKKYIYIQEMTGREASMVDSKNLLDFAYMFPISPETKKSLAKKYV
jgi:hypothetical protein